MNERRTGARRSGAVGAAPVAATGAHPAGSAEPAGSGAPPDGAAGGAPQAPSADTAPAADEQVSPGPTGPGEGSRAGASAAPSGDQAPAGTAARAEAEVPGDLARAPSGAEQNVAPAAVEEPSPPGGLGAELEALRAELDERTRDLQRITAEYANYRKRVDRDRSLVGEQATGNVLTALLPVLDDLDRAREHGDLVGPFGAVAEQLAAVTAKLGLNAFGEKGDPFDPTRHEAVAHLTSPEVTEPTCVDILRRGYLLGDRLLRPALVAVAEPE